MKKIILYISMLLSTNLFAEDSIKQHNYRGYLINVINPPASSWNSFADGMATSNPGTGIVGALIDMINVSVSDKDKMQKEAQDMITNKQVIDIYFKEIEKKLLDSGKFTSIKTLQPDFKISDNKPPSDWYGSKGFFIMQKGEYLDNPNFKDGQEIIFEIGLEDLFIKKHIGYGSVNTSLDFKVIDKETGKLIVKTYCSVNINLLDKFYSNDDKSKTQELINNAILESSNECLKYSITRDILNQI